MTDTNANKKWKIAAFLNSDSGTFKSLNVHTVMQQIKEAFEAQGHAIDIQIDSGKALIEKMQDSAASEPFDILLAGGGDGTISAAAGAAWTHGKILAVIPGGTMNLFARALDIPLDVEAAISKLATGSVQACDIATANGRAFVHQCSIGLHPRMIRKRNELTYSSRFGKIVASLRAFWETISHMPRYHLSVDVDGKRDEKRVSILAVSNNLFGTTAPPFAEQPDGGKLGIYLAEELSREEAIALGADLMLGRTDLNASLSIQTAQNITITIQGPRKSARYVLDGELLPLPQTIAITMHPGSLNVLTP